MQLADGETAIVISGDDVNKFTLGDICDPMEPTSFEIVLWEDSSNVVFRFEGIGITLPKERLRDIFKFLDAEVEKKNKIKELKEIIDSLVDKVREKNIAKRITSHK